MTFALNKMITEIDNSDMHSYSWGAMVNHYKYKVESLEDACMDLCITLLRIRICMFLGLLDPDPDLLVRGMDPEPSITKQKNSKKNLDCYYFVTSLWLFSLKNDLNVPSKSNKQKFFSQILVFVGFLKVNDKNRRIRIRIRIRIHWSEAWSTPKCHGSATLLYSKRACVVL